MNQDLVNILRFESAEIRTGFERARFEGRTTPQEISDRREEVFSSFLRKYFPFPYRIVKGNVIDSDGRRSDSIDCLILSPSHPYTIDATNKRASVIFADGVDYAIELKPDLTSKDEVGRALTQIRSIKKLVRKRAGVLKTKSSESTLITTHRIPGVIFSNKTYTDPRRLIEYIISYYEKENVPAIEQFEFLAVNNDMIVLNCRPDGYISNGNYRGIIFKKYGEDTLMMFLLHLNKMPRSEMEIGPNIMNLYIKAPDKELYSGYDDLNARLRALDERIEELRVSE